MLPWIEPQLQHLMATQRGHALLLAGPNGLGQFELALELARAWLCEQKTGQGTACGRCASCLLVASHTHPDLVVLLPETEAIELGWSEAGSEEADGAKAAKSKPSKEIRVDAVRRAVEFSQQTSARGVAKVVLVYPADRMNAISANTLLKTLEEPPGRARFVLATRALDALLPTIRSRCQIHPMAWPDAQTAVGWLKEQGVAGAEVMLAGAGGRPLEALQLARVGLDAAAWQDFPRRVAAGDAGALAGWSPPQLIDALIKLCHDAMCCSVGGAPRHFPAASLPKAPRLEALTRWYGRLQAAARHAEHPWNAGLLTEALVLQGQEALAAAA